jgi:hypothetical protein
MVNAQSGLVSFIGQRIGIPDLALDENGQVTVTLDDEITLTFLADEDELMLVSYIADYDGENQAISKLLLELNFAPPILGGAKLSISPNNNEIVLTHSWNCLKTDGEHFYNELEMVTKAVQAVRENIDFLLKEDTRPSSSFESGSLIVNSWMQI